MSNCLTASAPHLTLLSVTARASNCTGTQKPSRSAECVPDTLLESCLQIRAHVEAEKLGGGALCGRMARSFMGPLHEQVKKLTFFTRLANKDIEPATYLQYLANQHHAYEAVEALLQEVGRTDKYQPLLHPEVFRTEAFARDLEDLSKTFGLPTPNPSREVQAYVNCLREMTSQHPEGIVGIAFLRYSGLFLGRALEDKVKGWLGSLGVKPEMGVSVYDFPEIKESRPAYYKKWTGEIQQVALESRESTFNLGVARVFFGLSSAVLAGLYPETDQASVEAKILINEYGPKPERPTAD